MKKKKQSSSEAAPIAETEISDIVTVPDSAPVEAQSETAATDAAVLEGAPKTYGEKVLKIGRASCRERVFILV